MFNKVSKPKAPHLAALRAHAHEAPGAQRRPRRLQQHCFLLPHEAAMVRSAATAEGRWVSGGLRYWAPDP